MKLHKIFLDSRNSDNGKYSQINFSNCETGKGVYVFVNESAHVGNYRKVEKRTAFDNSIINKYAKTKTGYVEMTTQEMKVMFNHRYANSC